MATAVQMQRHVTLRRKTPFVAAAFLLASAFLLCEMRRKMEGEQEVTYREARDVHGIGNDVTLLNMVDERKGTLGCAGLEAVSANHFVASGWTKAVYRAEVRGTEVAVKRVNFHGHDMSTCLQQADAVLWMCYKKAAAKILKEILLLQELQHPNVLKVLGYCIPNGDEFRVDVASGAGIALVTELGESLDIIRLLQSSWEDRLRLTLGVTKIIHHLAHSPLGSLVMNDFRRQQFVLVNGELKLSDVDDMEFEEPFCSAHDECTIRHQVTEIVLPVQCVRGRCVGYNEKQNIYNAGRHFVTFLLPHGAPTSLRPLVNEVVSAYANVSWDVNQLLAAVERIYHLFVSGQYLNSDGSGKYRDVIKGYSRAEDSDLPGQYDYRCQLTLSGTGCTMSVFDEAEAAAICDKDRDCAAFVLTPHTSWTGRRIVHFKNNFASPVHQNDTTLFIKKF